MSLRRVRDPARGIIPRIFTEERSRTPGQGLETAGTSLAGPRPETARQARADQTWPINLERR